MEKLIIIAVCHKISEGILFPKDLEALRYVYCASYKVVKQIH